MVTALLVKTLSDSFGGYLFYLLAWDSFYLVIGKSIPVWVEQNL